MSTSMANIIASIQDDTRNLTWIDHENDFTSLLGELACDFVREEDETRYEFLDGSAIITAWHGWRVGMTAGDCDRLGVSRFEHREDYYLCDRLHDVSEYDRADFERTLEQWCDVESE